MKFANMGSTPNRRNLKITSNFSTDMLVLFFWIMISATSFSLAANWSLSVFFLPAGVSKVCFILSMNTLTSFSFFSHCSHSSISSDNNAVWIEKNSCISIIVWRIKKHNFPSLKSLRIDLQSSRWARSLEKSYVANQVSIAYMWTDLRLLYKYPEPLNEFRNPKSNDFTQDQY